MDDEYRSEINRNVPVAQAEEFSPLTIGSLSIFPPVVLAPMAGVTNAAFRSLCRSYGAGLYVSEMITARALVENNPKTLQLAGFHPEEQPRSLQLYGTDPKYTGEAVARLVDEDHVDHIDLNFGCPVRKVTRKGGGAAIPLKRGLLRNIIRASVTNAGKVPITIKFRIGIDDEHRTYLDAGRIAQEEGCAAVSLHARTASQLYDGEADWNAIATLKEHVRDIPVLGNGDIWEAHDALRMMRQTGCDGVVVGRGCLGRPWLFGDLAAVFSGKEPHNPPTLGQVSDVMRDHAQRLIDFFGERSAMRAFRKHATWYTKGFPGSAALRGRLIQISHFAELDEILSTLDASLPFPPQAMRTPRGKKSGRQRVALPEGYLDQLDDDLPPSPEAEDFHSGG